MNPFLTRFTCGRYKLIMTEGNYSTSAIIGSTIVSTGLYISVFNPLDVIRTHQQTINSRRPLLTAKHIVERHGIKGLWSGFKPNLVVSGSTNLIYFPLYELLRNSLEPYLGGAAFGISAIAARTFTVCTLSPIERFKT